VRDDAHELSTQTARLIAARKVGRQMYELKVIPCRLIDARGRRVPPRDLFACQKKRCRTMQARHREAM
jgi:hypothetical protein